MLVRIHCFRDNGKPIPKHQFAFKEPVLGWLTVHEERDDLMNRHTRIARLRALDGTNELLPALRDAQMIELTRERLIISGIERHEDVTISRIVDVAQTWVCWITQTK